MAEHALKTWPEYWAAIESGAKTFEVRRDDDRNFQPGDILSLREWNPLHGRFTGKEVKRWVTYVLRDAEQFGVRAGFVVLGLTTVPPVFAPPGHRYINGQGRCECGAPGNPLRMWILHAEEVDGASADCAASAGAQVAREQATDRAEDRVAELQRTITDQRAIIEDYQQSIAELGADPDQATVERGAEAISDLLTMLGVTPDERPEHGGPTTAEVLAAAVLGVRHAPVEIFGGDLRG